MNDVKLTGRLVADPEIKTAGNFTLAKYRLAVDRKYKKDGEQSADFINCVAFGKNAEVAEKYLSKGTKILLDGHIQTGSYINSNGDRVYTFDVVADSIEFLESKSQRASSYTPATAAPNITHDEAIPSPYEGFPTSGGFEEIPIGDDDLPF